LIIAVNAHHSIFDYRRVLSGNGILVMVGGSLSQIFQALLLGPLVSSLGNKKVYSFLAKMNQPDLVYLRDLLEARKIVPIIDRRYPLSNVTDAFRYREQGHARGKIIITLEGVRQT
jgi:D-arabinose 1-dehydrogenase-like Zn-dependent alcohol dehydrogenase